MLHWHKCFRNFGPTNNMDEWIRLSKARKFSTIRLAAINTCSKYSFHPEYLQHIHNGPHQTGCSVETSNWTSNHLTCSHFGVESLLVSNPKLPLHGIYLEMEKKMVKNTHAYTVSEMKCMNPIWFNFHLMEIVEMSLKRMCFICVYFIKSKCGQNIVSHTFCQPKQLLKKKERHSIQCQFIVYVDETRVFSYRLNFNVNLFQFWSKKMFAHLSSLFVFSIHFIYVSLCCFCCCTVYSLCFDPSFNGYHPIFVDLMPALLLSSIVP